MELTLFIDHQCNLRCTYCYNGDHFTRPMSRETMEKAVALALARPSGELHVSFFGGEPLMHRGLVRETVDYVERAVAEMDGLKPKPLFIMNTNATLIDDRALELMAPPRRWSVFVSLDGPKEVHDRYRVNAAGRGSFDDVVAGLQRLKDAAIPRAVLAVFGPATASVLGETLRTILPFDPGRVQFSANYRDEWTDESIEGLRAGLDDAGDVMMELFRSGTTLPIEPLHGKILTHLNGGIPCPSRCLLGGKELTVSPTGKLYPCAQMVGEDDDDTHVIGHVDTGIDDAALARLQAAKDRVEQTCADCELRDRCQSQCGCRHIALSGELGRITATLCEIEAAYIDASDRVAETLFEEKCPAFLAYYYGKSWKPARGAGLTQLRRSRDD
ncbi:MAG: radical SAM protein [Deltaproteobacteria bacterium]|nr:radical SAM protein [Deltaproteobacteria bacterium]